MLCKQAHRYIYIQYCIASVVFFFTPFKFFRHRGKCELAIPHKYYAKNVYDKQYNFLNTTIFLLLIYLIFFVHIVSSQNSAVTIIYLISCYIELTTYVRMYCVIFLVIHEHTQRAFLHIHFFPRYMKNIIHTSRVVYK